MRCVNVNIFHKCENNILSVYNGLTVNFPQTSIIGHQYPDIFNIFTEILLNACNINVYKSEPIANISGTHSSV